MSVMVTMEVVSISASVITTDAWSVAVDLDIDWMMIADHVKVFPPLSSLMSVFACLLYQAMILTVCSNSFRFIVSEEQF